MKIKDLLKDATKWTQDALARNSAHEIVRHDDPTATSWCLMGLVWYCYPLKDHAQIALKIFTYLEDHNDDKEIEVWNDDKHRTVAEIKALVETLDI